MGHSITAGVILIILATGLIIVSLLDICQFIQPQCGLNPLCWLGAILGGFNCGAAWFFMGWILRFVAVALLLIGVREVAK